MNEVAAEVPKQTKARSRTWREEADILLSMIDCLVLFDREAVYASSEFTTGKRFYELCRQYKVRTGEGLKKTLGKEYYAKLLGPNKEEGVLFACKLRESGHNVVLTPNPLSGPGWTQAEYLDFWEEVITKKCHATYFNQGWEFSNGCTREFLIAVKAGLPLFDHQGSPISVAEGKKLIRAAIESLETDGFDSQTLRQVWDELSRCSP
ncbi:MAG: hypothetical protein ACRD88_13155 [Terriglobia bacterium]